MLYRAIVKGKFEKEVEVEAQSVEEAEGCINMGIFETTSENLIGQIEIVLLDGINN